MLEALFETVLSPLAGAGFALAGYSAGLLALYLLSLIAAFFWPEETE